MENKTIKPEAQNKLKEFKDLVFSKSFILDFLLVVIVIGGMLFVLNDRPGHFDYKKDSDKLSLVTDAQVIERLKTIILRPDDVTPTMALVTDAETLRQNHPDFFANVKNGDRLIIYPDLAIIYDFEANKIIKVGPVENAPIQNAQIQQNN